MKTFDAGNKNYSNQFSQTKWIVQNEDFEKMLLERYENIMKNTFYSKAMKKAKVFEMLANDAPIAVDREDI